MSFIRKFFKSLRSNERGNITIETIYVVPLIMWTTLAFAIVWEYYRAVNIAQRATYAVADIVSRERVTITDSFIKLKYLRTFAFVNGLSTNTNALNNTSFPATIRVTSLILAPSSSIGMPPTLKVMWSMSSNSGVNGLPILSNPLDPSIVGSIPKMIEGDSIVLVETRLRWTPRLTAQQASIGPLNADSGGWMTAQTIRVATTVRPRFLPRLCANTLVGVTVVAVPCEL